jgi:hypothetical protein
VLIGVDSCLIWAILCAGIWFSKSGCCDYCPHSKFAAGWSLWAPRSRPRCIPREEAQPWECASRIMAVLTCVIESMGSSCSRPHSVNEAQAAENAKVTCRSDQVNAISRFWFLSWLALSSCIWILLILMVSVCVVCWHQPVDFARERQSNTSTNSYLSVMPTYLNWRGILSCEVSVVV